MQEALAGQGHALVTTEGDADAHVLVTCTVVETTERNMIRRMTELAAYDKPLIIAGCMAAAQRQRVLESVPRAKLLPPRKWPQIVELLDAGTACGERSADIESSRSNRAASVDARIASPGLLAAGSPRTRSTRSSSRSGGVWTAG